MKKSNVVVRSKETISNQSQKCKACEYVKREIWVNPFRLWVRPEEGSELNNVTKLRRQHIQTRSLKSNLSSTFRSRLERCHPRASLVWHGQVVSDTRGVVAHNGYLVNTNSLHVSPDKRTLQSHHNYVPETKTQHTSRTSPCPSTPPQTGSRQA